MDLPVSPNVGVAESDLQEQLRSLRTLLTAVLAAMLCLGGALFVFLFRQVSNLNRQLAESTKMVNEFQTNTLPKINWFVQSLQSFAKTNPDFNPILAKHNLLPPPAGGNPIPTPAAPPPKK